MGKKNKKLQAIFFDFDGVIVNSNELKTQAFYNLLEGYPEHLRQEMVAYHRLHGGVSRVEKIRYFHEILLGTSLNEKDLQLWASRYSGLVLEKVLKVEYVQGALEFLQQWSGEVQFFLISGTPEDELQYIIQERGLSRHFLEVLGSPVVKTIHIENLLAQYRLRPECCFFVGDALTDYDAARETGVPFIGIQGEVSLPEGALVLPDCKGLNRATGLLSISP